MRINSGKYKYRKILLPDDIRPTTEKVREAVCSMIYEHIPGARVLDLFAGSGAIGLELLSRGADHCVFNELDRGHLKILKENIRNCGADNCSEVRSGDFRRFLVAAEQPFDIIYVDPPYASGYYEEVMELIVRNELLAEDGVVIAEHLYNNELSDTYGELVRIRQKKYGTIGIDVFCRS